MKYLTKEKNVNGRRRKVPQSKKGWEDGKIRRKKDDHKRWGIGGRVSPAINFGVLLFVKEYCEISYRK